MHFQVLQKTIYTSRKRLSYEIQAFENSMVSWRSDCCRSGIKQSKVENRDTPNDISMIEMSNLYNLCCQFDVKASFCLFSKNFEENFWIKILDTSAEKCRFFENAPKATYRMRHTIPEIIFSYPLLSVLISFETINITEPTHSKTAVIQSNAEFFVFEIIRPIIMTGRILDPLKSTTVVKLTNFKASYWNHADKTFEIETKLKSKNPALK